MKRLLALVFVVIILLNTTGYYAVFLAMQCSQNASMAKILDTDSFDVANTVTLKIPMAIPYMSDNDFQRMDGLYEYNGEHYRLVKEKYEKDTLIVVCVRDTKREKLHQDLSDYVRTLSDKTAERPVNSKQMLSFIKDYLPQYTSIKSMSFGWEEDVMYSNTSRNLIPSFEPSIIHPPERRV